MLGFRVSSPWQGSRANDQSETSRIIGLVATQAREAHRFFGCSHGHIFPVAGVESKRLNWERLAMIDQREKRIRNEMLVICSCMLASGLTIELIHPSLILLPFVGGPLGGLIALAVISRKKSR